AKLHIISHPTTAHLSSQRPFLHLLATPDIPAPLTPPGSKPPNATLMHSNHQALSKKPEIMSQNRRQFLNTLAVSAGAAVLSEVARPEQSAAPFPLSFNQYSWITFYARDGKDWGK